MTRNAIDLRIVLVRPRNPLNIGAAARAMLNFGLHDLAVVAPHQPVWQEASSAVGAESVLQSARVVPHLLDAIEDRTLVLGTSSLERRQLTHSPVSLDHVGEILHMEPRAGRMALLFGSEKTGLSNEDMSYCHSILHIPTSCECPTMNLGQAVAVCCYEITRTWRADTSGGSASSMASAGELERLAAAIEQVVQGVRGPEFPSPGYKSRLRQVLLRSRLSKEDIAVALGVLKDMMWQIGHNPR